MGFLIFLSSLMPSVQVFSLSESRLTTELVDFSNLSVGYLYSNNDVRIRGSWCHDNTLSVDSMLIHTPVVTLGMIVPGGVASLPSFPERSWAKVRRDPLYQAGKAQDDLPPFGLLFHMVPGAVDLFLFGDAVWADFGFTARFPVLDPVIMTMVGIYGVYREKSLERSWFTARQEGLAHLDPWGGSLHGGANFNMPAPWGSFSFGFLTSASMLYRPGIAAQFSVAMDFPRLGVESTVIWTAESYRSPQFLAPESMLRAETQLLYRIASPLEVAVDHIILFKHLPLYSVSFRETEETVNAKIKYDSQPVSLQADWDFQIEHDKNGKYLLSHWLAAGGGLSFHRVKFGVLLKAGLESPLLGSGSRTSMKVTIPIEFSIGSFNVSLRTALTLGTLLTLEQRIRLELIIDDILLFLYLMPNREISLATFSFSDLIVNRSHYFEVRIGWKYYFDGAAALSEP
ncbi:MAG: hypothetical protein CMN78_05340 [Spirochaetales bacterium]|nr:hypothetical protein [Spirochaetales bacterium]